ACQKGQIGGHVINYEYIAGVLIDIVRVCHGCSLILYKNIKPVSITARTIRSISNISPIIIIISR
ncbi:MAG: hypothetical protein L0Y76_07175, partial [Ignavibacteria bacterium]|nr:hypothetical protein [Ignavibacteria bacterium]